jgi:hypothetical protein
MPNLSSQLIWRHSWVQSNGDPSGCYSLISSVAVLFTFFIKVKKIHVLMQKVKKNGK